MSGLTSVDGIISGISTSDIINAIVSGERRRIDLMQVRKDKATNELATYQSMTAKLLTVQSDAEALSRAATFDARTATSSNTSILTASAASRAPVASYDLTVNALARSHQVASQGFADTDTTTVGTGTLVLTVNASSTTVTIDTSNNTLEGVRDAINAAGTSVRAGIINDGGSTHPYRLLLSSTSTGVANAITITNNLAGGTTPEFSANSLTSPVADAGNYYTGTASAAGTYTGTAGKTYTVQFTVAGGVGVAKYKVSEDGGTTWGSEHLLTDSTIDVYDDVNGSDLGAQMTFTAADFGEADDFTMRAFVPTVQQAADAEVVFGSGSGQITITSATNRIADAIPGVTLSLASADSTKTVTIDVAPDKAAIKSRIASLVTNFNGAVDYITAQSGYDSSTRKAGVLLGNTSMMRLQSDLRKNLLQSIAGTETYDSLFSLGLSGTNSGSLSLDQAALVTALDNNFDDVAKIFKTTGTSTNSRISFLTSTADSQPTTTGYQVNITQAATRGTFTGTSITDPANTPLVIDSTNNQLIVTVDGSTSRILQLTAGTYTSGAALAQEIQGKIGADDYLAGKSITVSFVDEGATGHFEIRSNAYGASSSVSIGDPANTAAGVLGLTGGTATTGTDVAGTINGEAATGSGQFLTGNSGNATTAGIRLRVTLEPGDLGDGPEASLTLVKGVGTKLTELLKSYTNTVDGLFADRQEVTQDHIDSISKRITEMESVLAVRRQRLVQKYTAMEKLLAQMQQQSSYLSLQLSNMQSSTGSTSS